MLMSINGLTTSPAGSHNEGARANPRRFADITKAMYHWTRKRLPDPGAQNYAFETLGLVEFTPIGPAIGADIVLMKTQPPAFYISNSMVVINGLGGLAAGQIILQPLINPYDQTYGGDPLNG